MCSTQSRLRCWVVCWPNWSDGGTLGYNQATQGGGTPQGGTCSRPQRRGYDKLGGYIKPQEDGTTVRSCRIPCRRHKPRRRHTSRRCSGRCLTKAPRHARPEPESCPSGRGRRLTSRSLQVISISGRRLLTNQQGFRRLRGCHRRIRVCVQKREKWTPALALAP